MRLPGEALSLSIIPASFDLASFEEFAPRIGGLQRWVTSPTLLILTNVIDYSSAGNSFREFTVTDRSLSAQHRACLRATLQSALADPAGGRLQFAGVSESTLPIGSRVRTDTTPEGTIIVMATSNLDLGGRAIGYVSASSTHVLNRGAIFLNEIAPDCDPAHGPHLIGHELGHALGYAYNHVTRVPSIMSITPSTITQGVSSFDRDAIEVLYQRPPGNRAPDADLSTAATSRNPASLTRVFREPIR